jgi:hypothetical protein
MKPYEKCHNCGSDLILLGTRKLCPNCQYDTEE